MRTPEEVIAGVDRGEVCRYLGYRRTAPDEAVRQAIEACIRELSACATPRSVSLRCDLEHGPDGLLTVLGRPGDPVRGKLMTISSRSLSGHLRGCTGAFLMAATLGPAPDMLVRRAQVAAPSRMVILQAAGAAMIEAWCDEVNDRLVRSLDGEGMHARTRFSPGYGDLPLALQRDLSRVLMMPRTIGVTLTDTLIMTPTKSVTAIIGFGRDCGSGGAGGCGACARARSCAFSRVEEHENLQKEN